MFLFSLAVLAILTSFLPALSKEAEPPSGATEISSLITLCAISILGCIILEIAVNKANGSRTAIFLNNSLGLCTPLSWLAKLSSISDLLTINLSKFPFNLSTVYQSVTIPDEVSPSAAGNITLEVISSKSTSASLTNPCMRLRLSCIIVKSSISILAVMSSNSLAKAISFLFTIVIRNSMSCLIFEPIAAL